MIDQAEALNIFLRHAELIRETVKHLPSSNHRVLAEVTHSGRWNGACIVSKPYRSALVAKEKGWAVFIAGHSFTTVEEVESQIVKQMEAYIS